MSGEVGGPRGTPTYALPPDTTQQSLRLPLEGEPEGGDSPAPRVLRAAGALVTCSLRKSEPPLAPEDTQLPSPATVPPSHDEAVKRQGRLLPGWEITGGGPRPQKCGEGWVRLFCHSCGYWFKTEVVCKDRTCSHCGEIWANQQAAISAFRMEEVGRTSYARGAWGRHAIISPPRSQWAQLLSDEKYVKRKRRQAARVAARTGFRGLGIVFHPYRDPDEPGHYDVDGPHFHVTGWADKLAPLSAFSPGLLREGWIFEGVATRDGRAHRLKTWAMFYKNISYELGHCAIIPGMHAISYYGICHFSKVKLSQKERALRRVAKCTPCPKCGSTVTDREEVVRPGLGITPQVRVMFGTRGQTALRTLV